MTFVNNLNELKDKLKILEESQNVGGGTLLSFKSLLKTAEQNRINMLIENPDDIFINAPPDSELSNRRLYIKYLFSQLITLKQNIINDTIQTSESIANSLSGYQDLLNSRVGTLKINSKDLVSYAYSKKVMIVSPMSLFPMLQITVKALHNLKVEKSIHDILNNIGKLSIIFLILSSSDL